jgi:DNA modification methylase
MTPYYSDDTSTLYCGDCLDVIRHLPNESFDAAVTDPPFMLGAASARKSADKVIGWADINNASHWYSAWMGEAWRTLRPHGCLWIFANWRSLPVLQCAASRVPGMSILSHVVWDKQWVSVGSMRGVREQCELIVLLGKPEFAIPDRAAGNIWPEKWTSQRPSGHPQEKPVPLIARMLEASDLRPGARVFDGFMGRGSTGVACAEASMRFVGVEMESHHVEVARDRIVAARPTQEGLFALASPAAGGGAGREGGT